MHKGEILRKIRKCDRGGTAFIAILLLAIPLLLFVAVNPGMLPEICTPFLSVPRINVYRSNEFSVRMIPRFFCQMMDVLLHQDDETDPFRQVC